MTMVEREARLHEETVRHVDEHVAKFAVNRMAVKSDRNGKVYTKVKVDTRVLEVAKRLAKGDLSRLRIIDSNTVIVANPRD